MVVCKFFLEGRCRFGDDCRSEHPRGNNNQNRFAPLQNNQSSSRNRAGAFGGQTNKTSDFSISADHIRLDLKDKGDGERPIWPFSAYAPGTAAPRQLLEGPFEQSPEEMRLQYYIAQAAGQPQNYVNQEQALLNEVNSRIQTILNDAEGAKKYLVDGQNIHPNRNDECFLRSETFPWVNKPKLGLQQSTGGFGQPSNGFGTGSAPAIPSGFGQPSGLGAQKPAFGAPSAPVSGFGQASALGGGFGKPSTLGGGGFGQPSALGQGAQTASPFSQAAQPAAGGFNKPSLPGFGQSGFGGVAAAKPAFGQPSQPTAFGQPSQPAPAFGQPSQPSAFGQPSQFSAFGQPSQPAPSAFGQPSQPNGFGGQPKSDPFADASKNQPSTNPFAAAGAPKPNPFAPSQPSANNPFAPKPAGTTPKPFGAPSNPTTNPFIPSTAAPSGPSAPFGTTWKATNFHNRRIIRSDKGTPCIQTSTSSTGKPGLERVWFPDGPVHTEQTINAAAFHDREALPETYEGVLGHTLQELYEFVRREGAFKDGIMPEVPPKLEWIDWDL